MSATPRFDLDYEACNGGGGVNNIGFNSTSWDAHHACISVQATPPGDCSATVEAHVDVGVNDPVTRTNPIEKRSGDLVWGQNATFEDIPPDFTVTVRFANKEIRTFTGTDRSHPWVAVDYTKTTGHLTLIPARIDDFN